MKETIKSHVNNSDSWAVFCLAPFSFSHFQFRVCLKKTFFFYLENFNKILSMILYTYLNWILKGSDDGV
jgi:hypothetical protein